MVKSKFRSGIKLNEKDKEYYFKNRYWKIREHAHDFIRKRLAPACQKNDGQQTPWRGYPVFVAQHATATCCRRCLSKWHKIDKGKELDKEEIYYIIEVIMRWLADYDF